MGRERPSAKPGGVGFSGAPGLEEVSYGLEGETGVDKRLKQLREVLVIREHFLELAVADLSKPGGFQHSSFDPWQTCGKRSPFCRTPTKAPLWF